MLIVVAGTVQRERWHRATATVLDKLVMRVHCSPVLCAVVRVERGGGTREGATDK